MGNTLHIEFSRDMPVAAVEVVAPDLSVVSRTMLSAGRSKDVDVPSGRSFLRVHLPDGRVVTLDDPGNLTRIVSRASLGLTSKTIERFDVESADVAVIEGESINLETLKDLDSENTNLEILKDLDSENTNLDILGDLDSGSAGLDSGSAGLDSGSAGLDMKSASLDFGDEGWGTGGGRSASFEGPAGSRGPKRRKRVKATEPREPAKRIEVANDAPLQLRDGGEVRIVGVSNAVGRQLRGGSELRWTIAMPWTSRPLQLHYTSDAGVAVTVALPASTLTVSVRRQQTRRDGEVLCIKLRTQAEHADAILSYMYRGDMYAAQALAEWADEAEAMILRDDSDPYSGLVGAYLLLRLRRFDRLKDWVHQIADRFDFLPDGCIIWAWQQLHMSAGQTAAGDYILRACARGLPVYSEGLRLLLDGLCLMGEAGEKEHERMMSLAQNVLWTSPLVITCNFAKRRWAKTQPLAVEVTFAQ